MKFGSLICQRFTADAAEESLNNIFNMLVLAPTMWNVASKIIGHHWDDPNNSSDTGLHQTAGAPPIPKDTISSQQDFNSFLETIHQSHTATMVFLLRCELNSLYPS